MSPTTARYARRAVLPLLALAAVTALAAPAYADPPPVLVEDQRIR